MSDTTVAACTALARDSKLPANWRGGKRRGVLLTFPPDSGHDAETRANLDTLMAALTGRK